MEIKLKVYKNQKEVEKEYTTDTYYLMFGTLEDILQVVDIDSLETGTDVEFIKLAYKALTSSMDVVKPLIKDIFEGLTDEDLRRVRTQDLVDVLVTVVKYAIEQIFKGAKGKN